MEREYLINQESLKEIRLENYALLSTYNEIITFSYNIPVESQRDYSGQYMFFPKYIMPIRVQEDANGIYQENLEEIYIDKSFIMNRCFWHIGDPPMDNEIIASRIPKGNIMVGESQGYLSSDIYNAVVKISHAPMFQVFPESFREGYLRQESLKEFHDNRKRVLIYRFIKKESIKGCHLYSQIDSRDSSSETIQYMDGLLYHLAVQMHSDTKWFISNGFIQTDSRGYIIALIAPIDSRIGDAIYEKGEYNYEEGYSNH